VPSASFRTQKRNGVGVKTQDDITSMVIRTNTIDSLMIFSDKGKMYRLLVDSIPVGTNTTKGQSIKSLIQMEADENPTVIYSIYRDTDAKFVLFTTKNGLVKKTALEEYLKTSKKSGINALNIREDDELVSVNLIKDEDIMLVTAGGMIIKFNSSEVPITSRAASGVKGIGLKENDTIITTLVIRDKNDQIALFSEKGLGKKLAPNEVGIQKRAGKGCCYYKVSAISGNVIAASLISDDDSILICGDRNSICVKGSEIPLLGKTACGNQIIKNSNIISVSKV
jgi:DNA gyrase subunit A